MPFVYPVLCTNKSCNKPAEYKVAARWSDGLTEELKTYGLTCADCLPIIFRRSLEKQKQCRLAPGESLDPPGIFHLQKGCRDDRLERLEETERELLA